MKWFPVDIVKKIPDRKIQTINKELGLQFHVWHCPFPKTIMVLRSVVWQPIQPLRMTSPYRPSNHWPFIVSPTFGQFFIFWISNMFIISRSTTISNFSFFGFPKCSKSLGVLLFKNVLLFSNFSPLCMLEEWMCAFKLKNNFYREVVCTRHKIFC